MRHYGPDPSEALPVGEETLLPHEADMLISAMLAGQELTQEYFGKPNIDHLSPKAKATRQAVVDKLLEEAIESAKQGIIDHRSRPT